MLVAWKVYPMVVYWVVLLETSRVGLRVDVMVD